MCAVVSSLTATCVCRIGLNRVIICSVLVYGIAYTCKSANYHRSFAGACRIICVIVCVCAGAAGFGSSILVRISVSHAHRRDELWVGERRQLDPSDKTYQPSNFLQRGLHFFLSGQYAVFAVHTTRYRVAELSCSVFQCLSLLTQLCAPPHQTIFFSLFSCFIRDVGMDNGKCPWPLNIIFLLQYIPRRVGAG